MREYKKFHVVLGDVPKTVGKIKPFVEEPEEKRTASVVFEGFQGSDGIPEIVMGDQPISVASLITAHLNRAYSFGFARGRDFTKLAVLQGLGFNDPLVDGE